MKRIRTIAMYTDYDYHGFPIETSVITLLCAETMTPEQIEIAKKNQEKRLHSMAKRMPHEYWRKQKK